MILFGITGLVGLGLVGLAVLPSLVNVNNFRQPIEASLSQTLHRKVVLGDLHLRTLGGFGVSADSVEITSLDGRRREVQVRGALVELDLGPLLGQRISIHRLQLEGVTLWLRRDRTGRWNIGDLLGGKTGAPTGYTGPALVLVDSTINLADERSTPPRLLSVQGVRLDLQPADPYDLALGFRGKVAGQSLLAVDGSLHLPRSATQTWGADLNLKTERLQAEQVVGYLGQESLDGLKGFFDLDLHWQAGKDRRIAGTVRAKSLDWLWPEVLGHTRWKAEDLALDTDLSIGATQTGIKRLKLNLSGLDLEVQGSIPRYFNRPGTIDLAVKTNTFDPYLARRNLPTGALPATTRAWLAHSSGKGQVSAEARIAGPAARPAITGQVRFKDFALSNPQLAQPLEEFQGTVAIAATRLTLENLRGRLGKSPFELSGTIDSFRSDKPIPRLTFKSPALDLATAWSVLTSDLGGLGSFKNTLSSLGGTARVDLQVQGRALRGLIELQGATAKLVALARPVEDLRGNLRLNDGGTEIDGLQGQIAGSPIALQGNLGQAGTVQLGGQGTLNFPQALSVLSSPPPIEVQGAVPLRFDLRGTTRKVDFGVQLDLSKLRQLKFSTRDLTPAQDFSLRGTYTPARITLVNSRLALGGLAFVGGGTIANPGAQKQQYDLSIRSPKPLTIAALRSLFPETNRLGVTAGSVGLILALKGSASRPSFQAGLALQGVAIPGLLGGISGLTGPVALSNDRANTPGLRFQTNDGRAELSGSVQNFKDPTFAFQVHFARLNVDRLVEETSTRQKDSGANLTNLRGRGRLLVDQGTLSHLQFNQLQTAVQLDRGALTLDHFTLSTAGGRMSGDLRTNLTTREVQGRIALNNARAELLSSQLAGFPQGQIYGSTELDLDFRGKGNSQAQFLDSLDGRGSLTIRNGRLATLNLLGPIVGVAGDLSQGRGIGLGSLLGAVSRLNTGQFQSLGGNFTIQNGVANTNNFAYRSASLNMQAGGTLRLANRRADLGIQGTFTRSLGGSGIGGGLGGGLIQGLLSNILRAPQTQQPQPRNFSFEVHGPVNQFSSVSGVRLR